MTQGWVKKKLGDICEIELGKTPFRANKSFWDVEKKTGNVWLSIADLLNGDGKFVSDSKEYISDRGAGISKIVKAGTLLVSFKLTLGRLAFAGRDLFTNEAIASLIIKNENEISKNYLFHFLDHFDWDLASEGDIKIKGKTLNKQKLKEILVSYPASMVEQQRIVAILDEAFEGIATAAANAKKNLNNARKLFESTLQLVFANKGEWWEEKNLGEVCEFTQGIQRDVKLQSETQKENQVRFLRIVDFTQGNEPPRYIDNPSEKYILNESDVSLVRYGASTGFVCRGLEGALANNLFRVIPKSKKEVSNDFLFVFLISPAFQNVIKESMNGAAMPAISFGLIKDIPFPIVPLKEQQAIVQKLDALSAETKKLKTIYQQKLVALDELKKSILNQAFSGQLHIKAKAAA